MSSTKLTFVYLSFLCVCLTAKDVSYKWTQAGEQTIIQRPLKIEDQNRIHVSYRKNEDGAGTEERIGYCSKNSCLLEEASSRYKLSVTKKQNKDNTFYVTITISSTKQSDNDTTFIWRQKYYDKEKEKSRTRKYVLIVYDLTSPSITCSPMSLRRNSETNLEMLMECHITNVYPRPKSCSYQMAEDGLNSSDSRYHTSFACAFQSPRCTCNLQMPILEALQYDFTGVTFSFKIPKKRDMIIKHAEINHTYPEVKIKDCPKPWSINLTWSHVPNVKNGYCQNLDYTQHVDLQPEVCEDSVECPLCGPGSVTGGSTDITMELKDANEEGCPEKIQSVEIGFEIWLAETGDTLSRVDISGLTVTNVSKKDTKVAVREDGKMYYKISLNVLPTHGKDVAFRLAMSDLDGVQKTFECHAPLFENCAVHSTDSPKSITETTSRLTTKPTITKTQTPTTTTTTTQQPFSTIKTSPSGSTGTVDRNATAKTNRWTPLPTKTTTIARPKVAEQDVTSEENSDDMQTFNIVITSLPIVVCAVIIITIAICVGKYIRKRRRYRQRLMRRRTRPPKATTTKSDEGTVTIQNDVYGTVTVTDSGICCDATTEGETLNTQVPETAESGDVYANIRKPTVKDGGLRKGQYKNKDGLIYTTVDIISTSKKNDVQKTERKPVHYSVITFKRE